MTDPVKLLAYKVLDTVKSEAKPEAKAAPKPEASRAKAEPKAEPSRPKPEAKAEPEPDAEQTTSPAEAKSEARPDVKAEASRAKPQSGGEDPSPMRKAKPEVELKPDAKADLATLLNTSLGDLLVAGLVKDPEDAGRIIAAAVSQAKASITAPKAPETDGRAQGKASRQSRARSEIRSSARRQIQDTGRRDAADGQVNRDDPDS